MSLTPESLSRQLALLRRVLAVLPQHPLVVLNDILADERYGILAVVIEADFADDDLGILRGIQRVANLPAVGADLLDRVHDQRRRGERERTVGLGRLPILGEVV